MAPLAPEVLWAQRSDSFNPEKNIIYLTISVQDIEPSNLKLDLTSTKLTYHATNPKGQEYAVEIEFFAEIDPSESRHLHSARATECIIRKKETKQEFWPRLTKEKVKLHWLKTDFDKWADEDEQEEKAEEMGNFDPSMMSQFGGGDDSGGFGGIDFSKLGQGQDLSGLGGGASAGLDDDSEDEEMPDLEGDEANMGEDKTPIPSEPLAEGKGKAPIEELD